ncbi:MAG: FAD-dependent oxidoreductase, partial [Chlorobi bacterium]|nr:FAD-dependent oxidoreductase [Chlorobiota bacterium]
MNVAIIGNGVAGITAARHIRKLSDHQITVISDETEHHFSRTALMYVYMGHMTYQNIKPYEDWFWQKNSIDLVHGYVEAIDTANQKLSISGGRTL